MKKDHFISVVIGTHSNRNDILDKYAVQSVLHSKYPKDKFEIIIVDNNDNNNVHQDLIKMYSDNTQIRIDKENRPGICFVRNKGSELSNGDVVAFIDDDCEVDPLWLNRINEFYQDRSIMFGGGSIYDTCLKRYLRESKNDIKWEEEHRIIGGNMSFRKELFRNFQFDNNIVYGKDDFELIFRLLKEGYQWYFDENHILHHRSASQYRKEDFKLNKKGRKLEDTFELYFKLKKRLYAKLYSREKMDWQKIEKREKMIIFLKYFFISKRRYNLSIDALKRVEEDLNLLLE
jgi:glycosyltransferase involved in cell wall biosynthesis